MRVGKRERRIAPDWRLVRTMVALLAVLALVAAACGDDDDEATGSEDGTTSESSTDERPSGTTPSTGTLAPGRIRR